MSLQKLLLVLLVSTTIFSQGAHAWERGKAKTLALLPEGSGNPEAIAMDAAGDLYASTFAGHVVHFDRKGRLVSDIVVTPSSGLLLDLAFHPQTGDLLVIDFGAQQVMKVDPATGAAALFAQIPGGAGAAPNVLTFDKAGNVYISDSFQGVVWRTGATGGAVESWVADPLLTTGGFPPFAANGIAFDADESVMYVANTGNDTIVKVDVQADGSAGTVSLLTQSINGPDGLIVDGQGTIWVAANQANEIVALDPSGKAIAVKGDFEGVENGVVKGLLFPSDLVSDGKYLYVVNFALDTTALGLPQNFVTAYTQQVTRHSIARIRLDRDEH